mmetsp:Transcript_166345/g.528490  ORF Transcript_166345/g.528490 Transcript_166345/m.528490 type:complete len:206 (-) Transcript_166345:119-736(-)
MPLACMFNIGVFGGACSYFVSDIHGQVVGMSGGCYALQAMHLSDLVINWRERRFPRAKMCFLMLLILVETMESVFLSSGSGRTSHAAHIGGYAAGLLIGVLMGRSLASPRYERALRALALLFGFLVAASCVAWSQTWPPREIWEEVRWCWARQVRNSTFFGDNAWHCIRCSNAACIERWSAHQQQLHDVDARMCAAVHGWDSTDL